MNENISKKVSPDLMVGADYRSKIEKADRCEAILNLMASMLGDFFEGPLMMFMDGDASNTLDSSLFDPTKIASLPSKMADDFKAAISDHQSTKTLEKRLMEWTFHARQYWYYPLGLSDSIYLIFLKNDVDLNQLQFFLQLSNFAYKNWERYETSKNLLHKDELTGLYNYRYLAKAIDGEIRRCQRFESSFGLLFIDLDHFKDINDRFGHVTGSLVIKEAAHTITQELREVDLVFRYGGDEFVVLLVGGDRQAGFSIAERIRKKIEDLEIKLDSGHKVRLTASFGVASYPEDAPDRIGLLKVADGFMYQSKGQGRNVVHGPRPRH